MKASFEKIIRVAPFSPIISSFWLCNKVKGKVKFPESSLQESQDVTLFDETKSEEKQIILDIIIIAEII